MKLKIKKIRELFEALASLDGYTEYSDGKVKEKVYYDFSGKTKYNIIKNLNILKRHLENFDKTRDELIKSISGGKDSISQDDKEAILRFNKALSEILETEEEVKGLLKIKFNDLCLDDKKDLEGKLIRKANKIPNTVIEILFDHLIDENE
jgi:hypothetical protein